MLRERHVPQHSGWMGIEKPSRGWTFWTKLDYNESLNRTREQVDQNTVKPRNNQLQILEPWYQ